MQNNDIVYCRASTDEELNQILSLQKQNLPSSLSILEQENEGFLAVVHTCDILKQMNDCCAHCIAKSENKVVGYSLSMHPKFADGIEVLKPMFAEINKIISGNLQYIVTGQICVDKNYKKKGIFSGLYDFMKQERQTTFDNIITEVDAENVRSLNAHLAISFEILKEYGTNNKHWIIISLNCSDHLPDIT